MNLFPLFGRPAGLAKRLDDSRTALFRLALMWCHDRALADDLTQEALTKALQHADALRDTAKLRPWLFGILVNCWRDHLRARRPTEDIDTIEEHWLATEESCEHAAIRAQLAGRVRAAIARLPVAQREVLALVDLEECSYAEAAQILAIPMGTVMSRLCRGRAALRGLLHDTHTGAAAPAPTLRSVK
ncbi:MAG: RNA polymerase subunit sigma-24 [Leptothrix sp. (in: Bacteria)]|nr:RNA polymerase subunit sigma-24 [Leptothrix sp. (in: b-proteobacteria)]